MLLTFQLRRLLTIRFSFCFDKLNFTDLGASKFMHRFLSKKKSILELAHNNQICQNRFEMINLGLKKERTNSSKFSPQSTCFQTNVASTLLFCFKRLKFFVKIQEILQIFFSCRISHNMPF